MSLLEDRNLSLLDPLPKYVGFLISQLLDQIRCFETQIASTEACIDKLLPKTHKDIKLLLTAPGIGLVIARTIITEILSISYFDDSKYLISYSGLAPIEQDSAGSKGIIKLNRNCNYFLKYAFVLAAHTARRYVKYADKYNRDVKKHGKRRAKINLARKIAKAVFGMLTHQQPFRQ